MRGLYLHGERSTRPWLTTAEFFKRTLIVLSVALVPLLIWFLFDVILIVVGAILIAVLLHLVAEPLTRWCKLPQSLALVLSGSLIIGLVGGAAYLFGTQIEAELADVVDRANAAATHIVALLQQSPAGKMILAHMQGSDGFSIPSFLRGIFFVSANFLEALVVTVIGGFYLAAQPKLYRDGLGTLFPRPLRAEANETIEDIGRGLRLWLIGELILMALIGTLVAIAVWLIGLPSPLALGVIAGLAEFVPYLGPIVAAIPAVLVAITKGGSFVFWTVIAYLLIHQLEGNLIAPMIQRRLIFIPPAVMLLAIVIILFVFGGVSVVFAGPLAVIVFIAIKKLYVRDNLGEATALPGEPQRRGQRMAG
jgi:predicted PurR-regulated permease PerM